MEDPCNNIILKNLFWEWINKFIGKKGKTIIVYKIE